MYTCTALSQILAPQFGLDFGGELKTREYVFLDFLEVVVFGLWPPPGSSEIYGQLLTHPQG